MTQFTLKLLVPVALCVALALFALAAPRDARAEEALAPLQRALGAFNSALAAESRVGDFTWLEHDGLAVKLSAAPNAAAAGQALLATETRPGRAQVALWRLDSRQEPALFAKLGATAENPREFRALTANDVTLTGKHYRFSLGNGVRGLLSSFGWGTLRYALVLSAAGGVSEDLAERTVEIIGQTQAVVAPEEGMVAPLLMEGAFCGRLTGYTRRGRRLEKAAQKGWISVSLLAVNGADFATRDTLQFELEQKLKAQGLRRTGGDTASNVSGIEGYCGQYFIQGHITRILYAKLGGDYLVAVFHGHESSRAQLEQESMAFGRSLTPTGLAPKPPPRRTLAQAGAMEIAAWQDGASLCFGALFERPWRESGIRFEAKLTENGRTLASLAGDVSSSLELNPLREGGPLKLALPAGASGEPQFELRVGAQSASTRVTLR